VAKVDHVDRDEGDDRPGTLALAVGLVAAAGAFTATFRGPRERFWDRMTWTGVTLGGLAQWLPWVAGAVGAVLLAGGALWYWRMNQDDTRRRSRPRLRPSRSQPGQPSEIDASPVYCQNCGAQAGVSDHFCRRCGTRLRQ